MGKPVIDEETGRDIGPQTFGEKRFSIPVDTALVRRNGTVNANDMVLPEVDFEIPQAGKQGTVYSKK